ncbi:MAG TPA: DUF885 domain-containing protein [Steroidobacteraceae bacterium]|jgi:hypothetical protein
MTRSVKLVLTILACAAAAVAGAATAPWIAKSNQDANILLEVQAKYVPEGSSGLGVESYDARVLDLKPGLVARQSADLSSAEHRYEQLLRTETDPQVRDDLEILLKATRDQRASLELNDRLMLPYFDLPQAIYGGFQQLLDKRTAAARYPAALLRLKRYAGAEAGYEPITKLARDRISERLADPTLTAPWSVELQQALKNQDQYLAGIRDLFKESGLKGWEKDFATLSSQVGAYGKWVRATVLPRARASNLLPPEIYADNLKQYGVAMDPKELMDRALFSFAQTRDEMQTLSATVAHAHGWKSGDYRDVFRELKKQRIPDDKVLEVYRARLAGLEKIIREQKLLTLPQRAAAIRLATPAESAATPAPHMSVPRLLGNTGEMGEFVIPTSNPNADSKAEMDDFNYDAITWDLTAHEARPGHELQFAAMIEGGVSTARAVFAFNSANAEGWGLYSEQMVKPFLPPEAQLGVLQARLMRAARAFLDPMINLGMLKPEQAKRILMQDVVLSEPLAKEEIDRYTFDAPGQATSYFYGFSKLQSLRARVEIALGKDFDAQSYHDFILAQGLLPPELLEKAVLENYVKPRLGSP